LRDAGTGGARAARRTADRLLGDLGLAERRDAAPLLLSGGQQQRVALARAMAFRCRPRWASRICSPAAGARSERRSRSR